MPDTASFITVSGILTLIIVKKELTICEVFHKLILILQTVCHAKMCGNPAYLDMVHRQYPDNISDAFTTAINSHFGGNAFCRAAALCSKLFKSISKLVQHLGKRQTYPFHHIR